MDKKKARTIQGRKEILKHFCKEFDRWIKMSDEELYQECCLKLPCIVEATRDEMLKFMATDIVADMVGE